MRLTELNPEWDSSDGEWKHYLKFDCPKQHEEHAGTEFAIKCQIVLPVKIGPKGWHIEGGDESFENLTITPSIWHHCSQDPHFHIVKGEIKFC